MFFPTYNTSNLSPLYKKCKNVAVNKSAMLVMFYTALLSSLVMMHRLHHTETHSIFKTCVGNEFPVKHDYITPMKNFSAASNMSARY